jgi:hypothetical protein
MPDIMPSRLSTDYFEFGNWNSECGIKKGMDSNFNSNVPLLKKII